MYLRFSWAAMARQPSFWALTDSSSRRLAQMLLRSTMVAELQDGSCSPGQFLLLRHDTNMLTTMPYMWQRPFTKETRMHLQW